MAEFYGVSDEAGVSDELAVILKEAMEFIYYKYGGKAEVQFKIRNEEADERIRVLLPELEKRVVKRYAYGITS